MRPVGTFFIGELLKTRFTAGSARDFDALFASKSELRYVLTNIGNAFIIHDNGILAERGFEFAICLQMNRRHCKI